jgi:hypothetical protein
MTHDALRVTRNILLRSFVVGLVIAIVLCAVTIMEWDAGMKLATAWLHTSEATITPIVLNFFTNIRFFLLFILLTPALAIHWTIKKERGGKKK